MYLRHAALGRSTPPTAPDVGGGCYSQSRGEKKEAQTGVRAFIKEVPLALSPSLPDTLEQSETHNPSAAAGGAAERKAFWPGNLQQAASSPWPQHVPVRVPAPTLKESQLVLDVRF